MRTPSLLRAALLGGFLFTALGAGAVQAQTLPSELPPAARARCQDDPVKCDEVKKRMEAHREACKKDPEACKQRREAAQQRMKERCEKDPTQCKTMHDRHGRRSKPAPASSAPASTPADTPESMAQ